MTVEDKLRRLRVMTEDPLTPEEEREDDEVLLVFLDMAAEAVLKRMYPYVENYEGMEVPDKHSQAQVKIAAYLMNKRGADGEIQHIENGTHRNYGDADIPDSMLKDIVPYVAVIR